jgi:hypothetical protein
MAQTAEDLSKLSKDSLLSMAIAKISEPSFDVHDFNQIEVWLDDEEIIVSFGHAIKFIPQKGQFYYSVSVDLIAGSPTMHIEGKGPWDAKINFYKPSRFRKEIKFVLDAINNSQGEVGRIPDGKLPDGVMRIQEQGLYYDITVDSESTHSFYKIKKGSGKIYDAGHKHYAQSGNDSRKRIY